MTETYSGPRIFSIGRAFGRAIIILRRNIRVLGGLTTLAWGGFLIVELVVLAASAAGQGSAGERCAERRRRPGPDGSDHEPHRPVPADRLCPGAGLPRRGL
jgi:hypothetical protein